MEKVQVSVIMSLRADMEGQVSVIMRLEADREGQVSVIMRLEADGKGASVSHNEMCS